VKSFLPITQAAKWRLTYAAASGAERQRGARRELSAQDALWPAELADSYPVGSFQATQVRVLDLHELAAGKLAALLSATQAGRVRRGRAAASRGPRSREVGLGFVVYGAANRKDWRGRLRKAVKLDAAELKSQLLSDGAAGSIAEGESENARVDYRDLLSAVPALTREEREFSSASTSAARSRPNLLTDDAAMGRAIQQHPALAGRRSTPCGKHRGLPIAEQAE